MAMLASALRPQGVWGSRVSFYPITDNTNLAAIAWLFLPRRSSGRLAWLHAAAASLGVVSVKTVTAKAGKDPPTIRQAHIQRRWKEGDKGTSTFRRLVIRTPVQKLIASNRDVLERSAVFV